MGRVGVVVPAYNEASVIDAVLHELPEKIRIGKKQYTCELIIVDDGSRDGTADQVIAHPRNAHIIKHILNSGAGAATRTGINYAKRIDCDFVVTVDADGQHHHADVIKVAKAVLGGQADLVVGNRLADTEGMPWYRVLGNRGINAITFVLFGVWVSDSQSGLKGMNRKAMERITFHSDRYAFSSEMLWRAKQEDLTIAEVPIQPIYTEYSLAKGQTNWGALAIVGHLLRRRIMDIING